MVRIGSFSGFGSWDDAARTVTAISNSKAVLILQGSDERYGVKYRNLQEQRIESLGFQ